MYVEQLFAKATNNWFDRTHCRKMSAVSVLLLPEHDYVTFGYLPLQFRLSVICLSVICNVRASYSAGLNIPQFFYAIL